MTPTLTPTPANANATAAWLAQEVAQHGLYAYLYRALSASASFRREDPAEVGDHIHAAFAAWIKRDAFAKFIAAGKTPNRRNLVSWAKQVSSNTMRDRGTDALHRELRGARTEHEREVHAEREGGMAPWVAQQTTTYEKVTYLSDEDRTDTGDYDLVDLDAVDATELLARSELVGTVELVFHRACPRSKDAANRLNETFGLLAEEANPQRVAEVLGVSTLRAEKLAQRVRDRLRESEGRVRAALAVLRAVGDEPYMTCDEVQEALGALSDLPSTVGELVERGYLSEHKGGSYCLTERGAKRLSAGGSGWSDRLLL
jgi:hypothetical protein